MNFLLNNMKLTLLEWRRWIIIDHDKQREQVDEFSILMLFISCHNIFSGKGSYEVIHTMNGKVLIYFYFYRGRSSH